MDKKDYGPKHKKFIVYIAISLIFGTLALITSDAFLTHWLLSFRNNKIEKISSISLVWSTSFMLIALLWVILVLRFLTRLYFRNNDKYDRIRSYYLSLEKSWFKDKIQKHAIISSADEIDIEKQGKEIVSKYNNFTKWILIPMFVVTGVIWVSGLITFVIVILKYGTEKNYILWFLLSALWVVYIVVFVIIGLYTLKRYSFIALSKKPAYQYANNVISKKTKVSLWILNNFLYRAFIITSIESPKLRKQRLNIDEQKENN
ncbi:hypothetical protein H9M94_02860 [Mycoplasma sp. Pen4]|uniref:hypothetical protein n=1 Tax=Mycoplasma sp. Pen4 TaxID=640330 RepID=UPI001654991D|nr:hypothetical protein [Mycoplasma sp. Pen4]QNM93527.1 hypothetical protein H9M94_02860 [Mycoplasma sp. Pen4]